MKKKILIVGTSLIGLLLYAIYPYYLTHRLFKTITGISTTGDVEKLEELIDLDSFKASFAKEIKRMWLKGIDKVSKEEELTDNPLVKMATLAFISKLTDITTNAYIEPKIIPPILCHPKIFLSFFFNSVLSNKKSILNYEAIMADCDSSVQYAFFQSPLTFLVKTDKGMKLKLRFQGWTWRLTEITFPD